MSLLSTEPVARSRSPASESGSRLYDFLIRELPPKNAKRASYFLDALIEAGERYDRYVIRTAEWSDYASRRRKLKRITTFIEGTASALRTMAHHLHH